jgi:ABC-type phosphate transport system substrate-binding protein
MKGKSALRILALAALMGGCRRAEDSIVAYGRENNSGTYMYFKEHVLNDEDFAANVQTLPGTAAVINAVSKDRRSIGYGGVAYGKGVRILKVKKDDASPSVEATLQNVIGGTYPISRSLFFYTAGEPTGVLRHFVDWVRGPDGQKICAEVGYFPLPEDRRVAAAGPAPEGKHTITVKGSDTMVILGGRWAEGYMRRFPGVVIQITGGGSGTGIKALIDGETHVCQASRTIKPKEKEMVKARTGKEPVEIPVALDGLTIFVHESNPLTEITLAQARAIYTGKTRSWKELGLAVR